MKTSLSLVLIAALLAGCTPAGQMATEAGAALDLGDFGTATANNIRVQSSPEAATIDLGRRFAAEVETMVNFAFDDATLDPDAQAILRRQADWIRQFPEVRFRVFGHTDLVGTDAYNRALGQRRADAVVAFLVAQGIGRDRLEAVVSFGQTQPLIPTPNPERRNRRTVTEVSGFTAGAARLLNGKYAQVVFRDYVASAAAAPALAPVTGGD